ncbi:MAG: bifunctional metallophosphatase/5'-nucleotidase [Comamonas sp.]
MPFISRFFARTKWCVLSALVLVGCGHSHQHNTAEQTTALIDIHLLAFNDLHGHLDAPGVQAQVPTHHGSHQKIALGGMPWLAGTVQQLRQRYAHHAVVSAGDMVGSSPLLSSFFLDEPTIEAANAMQVDFAAVGNHEFDRGWQELLRLAQGGCEAYTQRTPCQVNPSFEGAQFPMLAANVLTDDGRSLLPATGLKTFTQDGQSVTVGFIGMTLKDTPKLVMESAVQGLRFTDEAQTANALVPQLLGQGADIIAVLLHEGGKTHTSPFAQGCEGLSGSIVPILEQLDPRISVVISGHTHQTYVCDYATINPQRPFLLTSAGLYGTQLTDLQLRWDPKLRQLHSRSARSLAIPENAQAAATSSPFVVANTQAHPEVQTIVERYRSVIAQQAQKVVGRILSPDNAPLSNVPVASGEIALGNLIADAQVWAMQTPQLGGADISFMHSGGIRAPLQPDADGHVRFDQLYAIQPFGNTLGGMTLTGAQIKALLEDTYAVPLSSSGRKRVLSPNAALSWRHAQHAPVGQQVQDIRLRGQPLDMQAPYRVVVSSFLANSGDRYTVFSQGTERTQGPLDIDALEAYVRAHSPLSAPATNRIR